MRCLNCGKDPLFIVRPAWLDAKADAAYCPCCVFPAMVKLCLCYASRDLREQVILNDMLRDKEKS